MDSLSDRLDAIIDAADAAGLLADRTPGRPGTRQALGARSGNAFEAMAAYCSAYGIDTERHVSEAAE